jgi:VIT1/CCC1 family predicted Fe2+/Mn2+ transporter
VAAFDRSDLAMLNAMKSLEFGVVESERRSPVKAMVFSGGLFLAGSLPSVLPFMLSDSSAVALLWATIFSLLGLFAVGVTKAWVAKSSRIRGGLENMVIAGVGGVAAWFIGDVVGGALS